MSHYSSSSPARTPGLVLGGAVLLGVTAALSLPFPLLGGILLTPALLAAAVTGYLNRPSSRVIALASSVAALLIALLSIMLIFAQPSGDLVVISALHTLYGFVCAVCALVGTAMLWLGRQQPTEPTSGSRPDVRTDLTRVGTAAAQGARHAVAAWETYQRLSEPRRERAAARAETKARRQAAEREMRIRAQASELSKEDKEIRKAQLRQAREYNSRFWF